MKDLCQYGNRPEDEWEILPWIPDLRPPFKIWVKPEQIAPFFLIPHHPYAISLLLKIISRISGLIQVCKTNPAFLFCLFFTIATCSHQCQSNKR